MGSTIPARLAMLVIGAVVIVLAAAWMRQQPAPRPAGTGSAPPAAV